MLDAWSSTGHRHNTWMLSAIEQCSYKMVQDDDCKAITQEEPVLPCLNCQQTDIDLLTTQTCSVCNAPQAVHASGIE